MHSNNKILCKNWQCRHFNCIHYCISFMYTHNKNFCTSENKYYYYLYCKILFNLSGIYIKDKKWSKLSHFNIRQKVEKLYKVCKTATLTKIVYRSRSVVFPSTIGATWKEYKKLYQMMFYITINFIKKLLKNCLHNYPCLSFNINHSGFIITKYSLRGNQF